MKPLSIVFLSLSLCFLAFPYVSAQSLPKPDRSLNIKRATGKIQIDGIIEAQEWANAEIATDFYQYFPFDSSQAVGQTEFRFSYDDHFLYFAVFCKRTVGNGYVSNSLRRDFRGSANDGISVVLDPFSDRTNGFFFGLNPYGVQREGLIANGGIVPSDLALSWDNKWYSEAKILEDGWSAEMAIPFKTLRFKDLSTSWRFNVYRIDSKQNERSTWIHVPRNFEIFSLAYTGEMLWDNPLKKPAANIALIPFVTAGVSKNHLQNTPQNYTSGIGGDAKVAVGSSLNLDLTVNPDFSQVEVDRQATNLDRFEIFFPERRQFFLENADLFADFGNSRIRPFFSRRIGIAIDKNTGQNLQNPIWLGARLSGKINQDWRVGLLNMQAASDPSIGLPAYNYTVAALQRRVFTRSNIGGILVNKQNWASTDTSAYDRYNRLVGLDYNLASKDNTWTGKFFYHQTQTSERNNNGEQFAQGATLAYNKPHIRLVWNHQIVGRSFDAQVGFVPRQDFKRINPIFTYFFFPKSKSVNRMELYAELNSIWDGSGRNTDYNSWLGWGFRFQNTSELTVWWGNSYTYLFFGFDPTNTGGERLPTGSTYRYDNLGFSYLSDPRKNLFMNIEGYIGNYFNGTRMSYNGTLNYRYQYHFVVSLDYTYNRLRFPTPYSQGDLFLIGPKLDITFSRDLFLTAFFQYNNQINNININTRLQWRFKPVSDIFLVYTDNYFADNLKVKNRGLIFKLTYWLNI